MFSRYRSYTTYSEENGKLVPSIEPTLIEVKPNTNKTAKLSTSDPQTLDPRAETITEKKLKQKMK